MTKDVTAWIQKAQDDINWASHDFKDSFFFQTCFISQQACEKALKAFIISAGQDSPHVHKLVELAKLCNNPDPEFVKITPKLKIVDAYYITTRYPDFLDLVFSKETAQEALDIAIEVVNYIIQKLKSDS